MFACLLAVWHDHFGCYSTLNALPMSPPPPPILVSIGLVSTPAHWVSMDISFRPDVHSPIPPTLQYQLPSSPIVMSFDTKTMAILKS